MAHSAPLSAAEEQPKPQILFTNVSVFDGKADTLAEGMSVLIEGNLIKKVAKGKINADGAKAIDGGGRILMPGLIESHAHLSFAALPLGDLLNSLPTYGHIIAAVQAEDMLMRGVTSARDMGGPVFGLKRAIDEGIIPGPRIYPSGTLISQTSGHADFRYQNQGHPNFGGCCHVKSD
jgi:imidazolonepropionase-like amidohydrolase